MEPEVPTPAPERKRSRSPGYPSFGLPEAIRKAELLYRHDKRNPVPSAVAAEHWGYSPTSSAVLLSVATLKKFGLVEDVGGGGTRQMKLTDLALHILLSAEGSAEWKKAVKEAALCPPIHVELWQQYGAELPSDSNLKRILILERGFADAAATDLIREYRETISFAGVASDDKMVAPEPDKVAAEAPKMIATAPNSMMSQQQAKAQNTQDLRRYAFPMEGAPDAELYVQVPMTEDNFEMLQEMLASFLKMSKRGLVTKKSNREASEAPQAE